jgi:hypothetical protein
VRPRSEQRPEWLPPLLDLPQKQDKRNLSPSCKRKIATQEAVVARRDPSSCTAIIADSNKKPQTTFMRLETIHRHLDGNGRIGRRLIALLLEHRRLLETSRRVPATPKRRPPGRELGRWRCNNLRRSRCFGARVVGSAAATNVADYPVKHSIQLALLCDEFLLAHTRRHILNARLTSTGRRQLGI